jgi:hypothetical protein
MVVMRNVFSSHMKIHKKYDLKGSTIDREVSFKTGNLIQIKYLASCVGPIPIDLYWLLTGLPFFFNRLIVIGNVADSLIFLSDPDSRSRNPDLPVRIRIQEAN